MLRKNKAFTLAEILASIVILTVLVSIVYPLYQRSVYRARYNNLIPPAKIVANGNEVYYLTHNAYATDVRNLDVSVIKEIPPQNSYTLVNDPDYAYVTVSSVNLPHNRHIIFQNHSKNFPREVHCEAAVDNELANWLCGSGLGGRYFLKVSHLTIIPISFPEQVMALPRLYHRD